MQEQNSRQVTPNTLWQIEWAINSTEFFILYLSMAADTDEVGFLYDKTAAILREKITETPSINILK
jgi:hypothetical protein